MRIGFLREGVIHPQGTDQTVATHRIIFKNQNGVPIEVRFGHVTGVALTDPTLNTDDRVKNAKAKVTYFKNEMRLYLFYGGTLLADKLANRSMTTIFDENGHEEIFAKANATHKAEDGSISYKVQKGFAGQAAAPMPNEFDRGAYLEGRFAEPLEGIVHSGLEEKNKFGNLFLIADGYSEGDLQPNGFVKPEAKPRHLTFLRTAPFAESGAITLFHEGVPIDSFKVTYNPALGLDPARYSREGAQRTQIAPAFIDDATRGWVIRYTTHDVTENGRSIRFSVYRLDGRLDSEVHAGLFLRDHVDRVHFNAMGLPYRTDEIEGLRPSITDDTLIGTETGTHPHKFHYTFFIEGRPGFFWVWDRDVNERFEMMKLIRDNDFVNGPQITDRSQQQIVVPEAVAQNVAERGGKLYFLGRPIREKRDRYTTILREEPEGNVFQKTGTYFKVYLFNIKENSFFHNASNNPDGIFLPTLVILGSTIFIVLPLALLMMRGVVVGMRVGLRVFVASPNQIRNALSPLSRVPQNPPAPVAPSSGRLQLQQNIGDFNFLPHFIDYLERHNLQMIRRLCSATFPSGDLSSGKAPALAGF